MGTSKGIAGLLALIALGVFTGGAAPAGNESKLVRVGAGEKLVYTADEKGNTIPDFSNCGYMGGGVRLPVAAVKVALKAVAGGADDTDRIQRAIDSVGKMPLDAAGLRGAVLLEKGQYRIGGQLVISAGGVVLRGEGNAENGTVLIAAGKRERRLIEVRGEGKASAARSAKRTAIADAYVPVGARTFNVENVAGFKVGQNVLVTREGNAEWIRAIGMDQIAPRRDDPSSTKQWRPFKLEFDRVITHIEGRRITIDAPIGCAIETRWGGGQMMECGDAGRIEQAGVENLRGVSEFDRTVTLQSSGRTYFSDEKHALGLVQFAHAKNCWGRDLVATHFYHGVATINSGTKWITVQDSTSLDPVSLLTGGRRYPFGVSGQLVLVLRCHSKAARHAFAVDARVPGPNAFVMCTSEEDYGSSEPHHRWSCAGLYDCVKGQIAFQDRGPMGTGHGWAGANYVAWNCEGSLICQQPPTAQNWAIGFVGKKEPGAYKRPDGWWEATGRHVEPRSLYMKQLEDRLGKAAVANIQKSP